MACKKRTAETWEIKNILIRRPAASYCAAAAPSGTWGVLEWYTRHEAENKVEGEGLGSMRELMDFRSGGVPDSGPSQHTSTIQPFRIP